MRGGVVLFRGSGADARRYVEADHSRADDYYLTEGAVALRRTTTAAGTVHDALSAEAYQGWVDWRDPVTGEQRGEPRVRSRVNKWTGDVTHESSPLFAEIAINVGKSLSVAAALDGEVSAALDDAQQHVAQVLHDWLVANSVVRVGPRGGQEAVSVERLETASVSHRTSRAGDPHRHIHFQISTRAYARGAWRALDTAVLFRQQEALRRIGEAAINSHTGLQAALAAAGLRFDTQRGEVVELETYSKAMSKRATQVEKNMDRALAGWREEHPGSEPSRRQWAAIQHYAWSLNRPQKKATDAHEEGWREELARLGYQPPTRVRTVPVREPAGFTPQVAETLATDGLALLSSRSSTWSAADVTAVAAEVATSGQLGMVIREGQLTAVISEIARRIEAECFLVIPDEWHAAVVRTATKAYTSQQVLDVEIDIRTRLAARGFGPPSPASEEAISVAATTAGVTLDVSQREAAQAAAGHDPLVVIEGAAGAGKTTMIRAARLALDAQGRSMRVLTPTLKAASVAGAEVGARADSIAKLLHANGWRWDRNGQWTQLTGGALDPDTGNEWAGVSDDWVIPADETIVIDEAGMVDQDTTLALLNLADTAGARIVLVGDRAQLPAVGRGGVLDMAIQAVNPVQMDHLHRFHDPTYADLSLRLRGRDPAVATDLHETGHIVLHDTVDDLYDVIAEAVAADLVAGNFTVATVATNDQAAVLSEAIQATRRRLGHVDHTATIGLRDGQRAGVGDIIQARLNDRDSGIVNRQLLTVTRVNADGSILARTKEGARRRLSAAYLDANSTLAYASTAHGVQGETADHAHVVVSDHLDAAGLYVGATRGKHENLVHVVATDAVDARAQVRDVILRDRSDRGVEAGIDSAWERLRDYSPDVTSAPVDTTWTAAQRAAGEAELTRLRASEQQYTVLAARLRAGDPRRIGIEHNLQCVTAKRTQLELDLGLTARIVDDRPSVALIQPSPSIPSSHLPRDRDLNGPTL